MDDDDLLIPLDRLTDKPTVWEGTFTPGDLERLEDSISRPDGEIRYRIVGQLDPQRRKRLSCIIEGFVFLTCQKSLEDFQYGLDVSDKLVLVDDESQLPAIEEESDAEDYLVAESPLDIRDLVEDAVLLALPMVPRKPGLEDEPRGDGKAEVAKASPFAALAGLKKTK